MKNTMKTLTAEQAERMQDLVVTAHAAMLCENMTDAELADVVDSANADVSVTDPLSVVLDEVVVRLRRKVTP